MIDTEKNKKKKWVTSSSPRKITKTSAGASVRVTRDQVPSSRAERPNEWLLASNKRLDQRRAIFGDRIILSSLRHPSLNITFTVNRWAHFVAMLRDIDGAACLRPLERKATVRHVSFRKHLGDGIYVNALYHKHIIDFCKHFAMYGESVR